MSSRKLNIFYLFYTVEWQVHAQPIPHNDQDYEWSSGSHVDSKQIFRVDPSVTGVQALKQRP